MDETDKFEILTMLIGFALGIMIGAMITSWLAQTKIEKIISHERIVSETVVEDRLVATVDGKKYVIFDRKKEN